MAGETPKDSDAALHRRHKQSAIVARLTVACFVAMRSGYARKHIGAVFEELLIALAIRINDDLAMQPLTASGISKYFGLPRSNVRRCLGVLIDEGVVRKEGERGYRGEREWLASRIDADYFLKIRDAIITAADELKALDAPASSPEGEVLAIGRTDRWPFARMCVRPRARLAAPP
jgi:hypothetical protein